MGPSKIELLKYTDVKPIKIEKKFQDGFNLEPPQHWCWCWRCTGSTVTDCVYTCWNISVGRWRCTSHWGTGACPLLRASNREYFWAEYGFHVPSFHSFFCGRTWGLELSHLALVNVEPGCPTTQRDLSSIHPPYSTGVGYTILSSIVLPSLQCGVARQNYIWCQTI